MLNILHGFGDKIILHTSRKSRFRPQTIKWLKKHGVKYHKIIMNKPKGDCYIDDKSTTDITSLLTTPK